MNCESSFLKLRNIIDVIDKKIIFLLKARCFVSKKIALYKKKNNKPIKDKKREKEIIKKIINMSIKKQLNPEYSKKIFKIIINESVILQELIIKKNKNSNYKKIFFLGPVGSYSHQAAIKFCNLYLKKIKTNACKNFSQIIKNTTNKIENNLSILPLYNTHSGAIHEVYDLLQNTNLSIINEIKISINHYLLTKSKCKIENIKTIYSHHQPIKQCSNFLKKNKNWIIKYTNSSSEALQKISKEKKINIAAIGGKLGKKIYNLYTVKKNINNKKNNITTFIVLGKQKKITYKNNNKLMLILNDNVKFNYIIDIISNIDKKNMKINNIESRPSIKNNIEKIFFIEILLINNIDLDTKHCFFFKISKLIKKKIIKILGCYPSSNI
ncbi:MAG TPA: prephenate dehydratase domain-containing protein [Buchnera sp. (in: enterobacteria)]|nr:prephenate dehydratase domain-containing protein [Buchnera sp. (in: enterobacteria)]